MIVTRAPPRIHQHLRSQSELEMLPDEQDTDIDRMKESHLQERVWFSDKYQISLLTENSH